MMVQFNAILITRFLAAALILISCHSASADGEAPVSFCVNAAPHILDPAKSIATADATFLANNVHQPLLRVIDNSLQANLALAWEEIIPEQYYRFKLRPKIAFHSLRKFQPSRYLDAQDVVYSLGRLIENANVDFTFDKGTRISAIDQYTVELHTPKPVRELLYKLSSNYTSIVSAEYARSQPDKHGSFRHPGTGPYKIVQSIPNKKLVLQRFDDYWGEPANVPFVKINAIPNQYERFTALRKKQCHVAIGLSPKFWPTAEREDSLHKVPGSANITTMILFNTSNQPTDQISLRQAIAFGLDREKIIRLLAQPLFTTALSLVPPDIMDHDLVTPIEFNPQRAKQLISEMANPPESITLEIVRTPTMAFPFPRRLAEQIQSALTEIGLQVEINYHKNIQSLITAMFSDKMQLTVVDWQPDSLTPTPKDYLEPLLACPKAGQQAGVTRWCNEKYDQLIYQASDSQEERGYIEAVLIANKELPAIPLWHLKDYDLVSNNLSGYRRKFYVPLEELELIKQ